MPLPSEAAHAPSPKGIITGEITESGDVRDSSQKFAEAVSSQFGPPPGLIAPPYHPGGVAPLQAPPGLTSSEDVIIENLRQRALPEALGKGGSDPETRRRCRVLRSCLESLYRDRIEPTLGEVQERLRSRGWNHQEIQGLLPLCAQAAEEYIIVLPQNGKALRVFLRNPPAWFDGWLGKESTPAVPPEVWPILTSFLQTNDPVLTGTVHGAAQDLRQLSLPPPLQQMSLGEIREVVRHAIADQNLLDFSGWNICSTQAMLHGPYYTDESRCYTQI